MERILVIGSPGAGKSTLARRIAGAVEPAFRPGKILKTPREVAAFEDILIRKMAA
jgi:adenylate kinase family enzyme